MYIFCSKALADALNIKKNELQKMPADAQMDDLYAWHGHITKLRRFSMQDEAEQKAKILTYFYPEVTVEKMSTYRKKQ